MLRLFSSSKSLAKICVRSVHGADTLFVYFLHTASRKFSSSTTAIASPAGDSSHLYVRPCLRRRVVVSGVGLLSPFGSDLSNVWQSIVDGRSAIRELSQHHDPRLSRIELPNKYAGWIRRKPLDSSSSQPQSQTATTSPPPTDFVFDPEKEVPRNHVQLCSPFIEYGIAAARRALINAGFDPAELSSSGTGIIDSQRFGVCFGSGIGSLEDISDAAHTFSAKGRRHLSAYTIPRLLINLVAGQISMIFNARGPNHSVSTACTTGAHSIGDAFRLIRDGDADVMIAGGTEASVHPLALALFSRARALSSKVFPAGEEWRASRPFHRERDGFVMSEGAAALILESYEHAVKRAANNIYAEIVGYGLSGDAYHVTAPSPDGRGAALCMNNALRDAQMNANDIDYLNAHATSTPVGDGIECRAIRTVFGDHCASRAATSANNQPTGGLFISSTKGAVGHMLGAAGAAEAVLSLLALRSGVLPPTVGILSADDLDTECRQINIIGKHAVKLKQPVRAVMSNSFGFGGTNASLIFRAL